MSFFYQRKPIGFQHQYLYVDERKERLKELEQKVMAELGLENTDKNNRKDLRGSFKNSSRYQNKRKCHSVNSPIIMGLFMLLLVILVLWMLMEA